MRARLERLQNLRPLLETAGAIVRDAAKTRIHDQGGDQNWPPKIGGGHTGIDTGRMLNSISFNVTGPNTVEIGTNVGAGTGKPYPLWFQKGTGVYVGNPPITPKTAQALSFVMGGVRYFARSIKGQPPRPFLLITEKETTRIRNAAQAYVDRGL